MGAGRRTNTGETMGYLEGKTCYLTGPIYAVKDDGVGWRSEVTVVLKTLGVTVDDPTKVVVGETGEVGGDKEKVKSLISQKQFLAAKKFFYPIVRKDLRSVDKCDFLIFAYDPDIPMVGTIHELVVASLQKKPILMYVDESKLNKVNPWMLTFVKDQHIFTSWGDLFYHLGEVNRGVFNTSYWVL